MLQRVSHRAFVAQCSHGRKGTVARSAPSRTFSSKRSGSSIYCFGDGSSGQLGNGSTFGIEAFPTRIENIPIETSIAQIACGSYHSLAVTESGGLWTWGWATFQGSANIAAAKAIAGDESLSRVSTPFRVRVGTLEDKKIKFVAAGRRHTVVATGSWNDVTTSESCSLTRSIPSETNELFVFGIGENYQLGLGTTNNAPLPQEVVALRGENIVQVACGWGHNVALTASGDVITWGWNQDGQCGTGDTQNVCEPKKVAADIFRGTKIVSVAAGADHSMAIDSCGNLFGFGSNKMHQLGLSSSIGPVPIATHPTLIPIPNSNIVKVYGGFGHTLGLTDSGQVWSFGYNLDGQCGTGEQCDYVESPTLVSFGEEEGVKAVNAACGRVSSYVISDDGRFFSFGSAAQGRLGNGSRRPQPTPQAVSFEDDGDIPATPIQVAAGMDHCVVLTE